MGTYNSPYFTHAKPIRGQAEIPMGTVHTCTLCKSDFICDYEYCRLDRVTVHSPCCNSLHVPHSQDKQNRECQVCCRYDCTRQHVVCPTCYGVDAHYFDCETQPGYQFKLL
jgi:hypothetical protein